MFTHTSSYARVFIFSTFLAVFSLSLAPIAVAVPGILEATNLDSTLNAIGHVNTPVALSSQDSADITTVMDDASLFEAPKVDKWVSRPLKQFNPHDVEGTKVTMKLARLGGDKTVDLKTKPSIRLLKRDYWA